MSLFHNDVFQTFDGEPIPGRTPPRVLVFGKMTKVQETNARAAYHQFCTEFALMLGNYHSVERKLGDGTRIRMVSNSGLDLISIWPVGGPVEPIDPSGYLTTPIETKFDGKTQGWNTDDNNNTISADAHISIKDKSQAAIPPPITLHSFYRAGVVSWKTPTGFVLSYNGEGTNRYSTNLWDTAMGAPGNLSSISADGAVYYRGTRILTGAVGVVAAGVVSGWLVIFSQSNAYFAASPFVFLDESLSKGNFISEVDLSWQECELDASGVSSNVRRCSAWHFKPDGTQAACAIVSAAYSIPTYPWGGGDITPPAGPGYVPPFDHSNTWFFKRALSEALPQAKRYANLTVEGPPNNRIVKLTFVDVPFVGEPLGAHFVSSGLPVMKHDYMARGTWLSGGSLTYAAAANPTGSVVYTGKRLWGIDYDDEGNELLITMHITGTGDVPTSTTYSMDMKWDLRVNNVVLFEVPTIGSTSGNFECHYVSLCDIDARYKAVTYERLVRTATGPNALGTGVMTIEHVFDGTLVFTDPVTVPTEMTLTARPQASWVLNPTPTFPANYGTGSSVVVTSDNPGLVLQCGPAWLADNSYGHGSGGVHGGCWPQVQGGSNGENTFDYIVWSDIDNYYNAWDPAFADGFYPTGPQQYSHYGRYPNQITDALLTSWCHEFRFNIASWSEISVLKSSSGGWSYYDFGFNTQMRPLIVGDTIINGFRIFDYVRGLAKKDSASDHYMTGTVNTYSWSWARFMESAHLNPTSTFAGSSPAVFVVYNPNNQAAPMHATASLFVRQPIDNDNPGAVRAFTRYEAMGWMADKITAEQSAPEATSFRIDPIRVI